jgi:hypothetical protein
LFKAAEEVTGVSEEALRTASTGKGRQALQAQAGKLGEQASRFLDELDKAIPNVPEKKIVDQALPSIGKLDVSPVFRAMEDVKRKVISKGGAVSESALKGLSEIDKEIEAFRTGLQLMGGTRPGQFFATKLDAEKVINMRRSLDAVTDFGMQARGLDRQAAGIVNEAKKAGRTALKEVLEKGAIATGNPQYVTAMRGLAEKLDKIEKVEDLIGRGKEISRKDRAINFLKKAAGEEGPDTRNELLQNLDDIFGSDFTEKTKLSRLAAQLGPEGKATWLPRQTTGRSLVSKMFDVPVVGKAARPFVASPKVFTRVTIPTAEALSAIGRGAKSAGRAGKTAAIYPALPFLRELSSLEEE